MGNKKYKILQCASIYRGISREMKYGGTQRVIDALNQTYDEKGHKSLVAGIAGSDLGGYGKLIPLCLTGLFLKDKKELNVSYEEAYEDYFGKCLRSSLEEEADIIHDNSGFYLVSSKAYSSLGGRLNIPIITTLHGVVSKDKEDKYEVWKKVQKANNLGFVAISKFQKRCYRDLGLKVDTHIYHGVPIEKLPFKENKQDYLFWIGWVSSTKGPDFAVKVARKTGRPLILAGPVSSSNRKFFDEKIAPFLSYTLREDDESSRNDLVERLGNNERVIKEEEILYVGSVNDKQKSVLYQNACALLMPNRIEESFGLVMAEAMATGTLVIGPNLGSIPEVITNGETGYIVEQGKKDGEEVNIDEEFFINEIIHALDNSQKINPFDCRTSAEQRFSRQVMAEKYIDFYERFAN